MVHQDCLSEKLINKHSFNPKNDPQFPYCGLENPSGLETCWNCENWKEDNRTSVCPNRIPPRSCGFEGLQVHEPCCKKYMLAILKIYVKEMHAKQVLEGGK